MPYSLSIADYSGYKRITRSAVEWFVNHYELNRYKFDLDIIVRGLRSEGLNGCCTVMDSTYRPREFVIEVHSGLEKEDYISTLMHELLHLKQWLVSDRKERRGKNYWHGKLIDPDTAYEDEPWEREAFGTEAQLCQQFLTSG